MREKGERWQGHTRLAWERRGGTVLQLCKRKPEARFPWVGDSSLWSSQDLGWSTSLLGPQRVWRSQYSPYDEKIRVKGVW